MFIFSTCIADLYHIQLKNLVQIGDSIFIQHLCILGQTTLSKNKKGYMCICGDINAHVQQSQLQMFVFHVCQPPYFCSLAI